jgi:glycosyltransferase involved in cell wall biosynthesis
VKGSSIHGVSRLFSWWFPRFDASRYRVRLVGLRAPDAAVRNLEAEGIEVVSLSKGRFDPTTYRALAQLARAERADVLHLHGYGAANFGMAVALAQRIPTVVHEHVVDPRMPAYQVVADALLAARTDAAIAVSGSVKRFMADRRRIPEDRIEVIFNGAPLDAFQERHTDAVTAEEVRRRLGLPAGVPVVGTIGRIDRQKGNAFFVEAAAQVLARGHKVKFLVVGDGPLLGELRQRCAALGIQDDVVFAGYQSDTRSLQTVLAVQVFPSLWEGTPLTLFEAMAMGRTIVATDVDGLGEVLQGGRCALLVRPGDAGELAKAIERALGEPALARALAAEARAESHRYDIRTTVERIEAVYERVAGSRRGGIR